jgi:hypothetical protein
MDKPAQLRTPVTRQRQRPQVMPVATLGQAAMAVGAAHRIELVHRDVNVAAPSRLLPILSS